MKSVPYLKTLLALPALAGAVLLAGCASGHSAVASADETYTPTGTIIPRKNPNRADMPTIVDKQAMENDRTMGSANTDGLRK